MPARNVIKPYLENGFYHIYNRGVEKRDIFQDEQDYRVFLSYLKEYLGSRDEDDLRKTLESAPWRKRDKILKRLRRNNFSNKINLLAYCLVPNHFHLLIKQKDERGIERFMRSLGTRYVGYFNKRYKRVGGLFQDAYKAVIVETDEQLLHLSRYIHRNAPSYQGVSLLDLLEYPYSSMGAYLGKWQAEWLKPKEILDFFSKTNKKLSYKAFVLEEDLEREKEDLIGNLMLE